MFNISASQFCYAFIWSHFSVCFHTPQYIYCSSTLSQLPDSALQYTARLYNFSSVRLWILSGCLCSVLCPMQVSVCLCLHSLLLSETIISTLHLVLLTGQTCQLIFTDSLQLLSVISPACLYTEDLLIQKLSRPDVLLLGPLLTM